MRSVPAGRSGDGADRLIQSSHKPAVPLAEIEARMQPGSFSQAGFLGPGERLEQVLTDDAGALAELGLSARALAEEPGELL